ncbi:hypothetical protein [Negadavirga shengliensis]|jgi:hypothetical protein|uniref:Uncharacterized protein n=1 Tax=Negadavirga shengliensis TaxID=1389218 RepID=A0ABV9T713_9BACT
MEKLALIMSLSAAAACLVFFLLYFLSEYKGKNGRKPDSLV